MEELKKEYAEIKNQSCSGDYFEIQENLKELLVAKSNLSILLNKQITQDKTEEKSKEIEISKTRKQDKTER